MASGIVITGNTCISNADVPEASVICAAVNPTALGAVVRGNTVIQTRGTHRGPDQPIAE